MAENYIQKIITWFTQYLNFKKCKSIQNKYSLKYSKLLLLFFFLGKQIKKIFEFSWFIVVTHLEHDWVADNLAFIAHTRHLIGFPNN